MKNVKVNIEGKDYNIDLDKAKELGIVSEVLPKFKVGDVWGPKLPKPGKKKNEHMRSVILQTGWRTGLYYIAGSFYGGLEAFFNPVMSEKEMSQYLVDNDLCYYGNINGSVSAIVANLPIPKAD